VTLAAVLANGNDAGTASITAQSGAKTIWNGGSGQVPNAAVQGLTNLGSSTFSAYPLALGTDIPAASVKTYAASSDPAYKLSSYPLTPGTDVTNLGKVVAKAVATELTTTAATTVLTYTPTGAGVFLVRLILTVKTAVTTVTASLSWTGDSSGASETYTWENASSLPVGTRLELPLTIDATSGSAIEVSVTAGTASQVYASGSITELV
jgi:hypothetical protein